MNHRGALAWAIVAAAFVLAGCFGRGSGSQPQSTEPAYVPETKTFELYLKSLGNTGGQDNRWELYPGAKVEAWAFTDDPDKPPTIPGPEIRVRQGDTVEVTLNLLGVPMAHTLHWHGVHVPWDQDGVPYVSQAPLGARAGGGNGTFTYTYAFKATHAGTYWYHCHVDTQHHLDMGMYGAFIVEPADPGADLPFDQEETIFFDEWDKSHIHTNPQLDQVQARSGQPEDTLDALYAQFRDYYQQSILTNAEGTYVGVRNNSAVPQPVRDFLQQYTPSYLLRENRTWYPFTYAAYYADYDTFLLNGKAFPSTKPVVVESGKTIRLRFVNAGNLVHAIHLHGHHMLVTHTDGFKLDSPYYKDTLAIAPGERYDAYVKLDNPGPWMLHDHMSQHEQNDNINPGGMSTMVCYKDGWVRAGLCAQGDYHGMEMEVESGDVLHGLIRYFQLTQGATVQKGYTGHQH